jgi:hypothetical protein
LSFSLEENQSAQGAKERGEEEAIDRRYRRNLT